MEWQEYKNQLLKDSEFKRECEALEPEYQRVRSLIRLQLAKGLTQEQLDNPQTPNNPVA